MTTQNKLVFRMSSAGSCARALSAEYLGYKPEEKPSWLETAAEEGKWHEERLVQEIINSDHLTNIIDRQLKVKIEQPAFVLLGHIDGKKLDYERRFASLAHYTRLLEIKSMSQYEFDRWMKDKFNGFQEYADQIACYMEATGLSETAYYVKNRSSGYIDKAIIRLGDTAFDDWTFAERVIMIIDKLETVAKHVARKELMPAVCDMGTLQCRRCFYKHLCIKTKEDMSLQDETMLHQAAENWRTGKKLENEAKELIEASKETFEEHLLASKLKNIEFDNLIVSDIEVKEHLVSYTQKAYRYTRIDDTRKEE